MLNSSTRRILACLILCFSTITPLATADTQASADEATLWNLERAYWRYVQANDLVAYRSLWQKDFLGWPSVSHVPVHKDHITDWITSQTSKGLFFQADELIPAGAQVSGDIAVVYYRVTYKWVDKNGNGSARTIRITHTWHKEAKTWQIIGGMSMLEPDIS
jgi:ketosteroid isomerase-like protein